MMWAMIRDWARLGAALRAAREDLGIEQQELAGRIGVHRNGIGAIEAGRSKRVTPTIRAYAREVGWSDESVDAVLAGGNPEPRTEEAAAEASQHAFAKGMPMRIAQELSEGEVLDTEVLDLTAENSDAVMIVVVKRGSLNSTDKDQMRRELREWSRVQRGLRKIVSDEKEANQ
jgi:transcriptional regulator with XRE-family HTH domain